VSGRTEPRSHLAGNRRRALRAGCSSSARRGPGKAALTEAGSTGLRELPELDLERSPKP
jgi:hypothetical protein